MFSVRKLVWPRPIPAFDGFRSFQFRHRSLKSYLFLVSDFVLNISIHAIDVRSPSHVFQRQRGSRKSWFIHSRLLVPYIPTSAHYHIYPFYQHNHATTTLASPSLPAPSSKSAWLSPCLPALIPSFRETDTRPLLLLCSKSLVEYAPTSRQALKLQTTVCAGEAPPSAVGQKQTQGRRPGWDGMDQDVLHG